MRALVIAVLVGCGPAAPPAPSPAPRLVGKPAPAPEEVPRADAPTFDTAERDVFDERKDPTATTKPGRAAPADDRCAEVACFPDGAPNDCCPPRRPARRTGTALDAAQVKTGLAPLRAAISACATTIAGVVRISVTVTPGGRVDAVTIKETPDTTLGECVARVMRTATFAKTDHGGTFTAPFRF